MAWRSWLLIPSLTLAGLVALSSAAWSQAPPPASAPATAPQAGAPPAAEAAEDHIFALVQAGKCSQARAAAEQSQDANLAEQIGLMCGAKPSGASGGGGGRRGGGSRGGSSGAGSRVGH